MNEGSTEESRNTLLDDPEYLQHLEEQAEQEEMRRLWESSLEWC